MRDALLAAILTDELARKLVRARNGFDALTPDMAILESCDKSLGKKQEMILTIFFAKLYRSLSSKYKDLL